MNLMMIFIGLLFLLIILVNGKEEFLQQQHHHRQVHHHHEKAISSHVKWLKQMFVERYFEKCSKYAWIEKYVNNYYQFKKYTVFIFDDKSPRPKKGGFGDRLAGMLTAFLWSVRSNRTFLIESVNQRVLFDYFQPFPYYLYRSKTSKNLGESELFDEENNPDSNDPKKHLRWSDWNKHWSYEGGGSQTYVWCINPKPRQIDCGFDSNDTKYNDYTLVRIRSNRCYLCRWLENPHFPAYQELTQSFNITKDDNLFVLAGCVLRNILWPTPELWKEVEKQIELYQRDNLPSSHFPENLISPLHQVSAPHVNSHAGVGPTSSLRPKIQIGVHFRCGDHNYNSQKVILHPDMENHMACSVKENEKWNGTMAVYEFSSASPIDMAKCVNYHQQQLAEITIDQSNLTPQLRLQLQQQQQQSQPSQQLFHHRPLNWLYISSDNLDSSHQIFHSVPDNHISRTIISSKGCHLDYNPNHDCMIQTFVSWFLLTLNNRTIVQSYFLDENQIYLPSSSFARYAMMYSLVPETFDFGDHCYLQEELQKIQNNNNNTHHDHKKVYQSPFLNPANTRVKQGNWVCVGKDIY